MDDQLTRLRAALAQDNAASSDFDLNPSVVLPQDRVLRDAGVLVAVTPGRAGLDLYLTKRSSALKHHPGQIAFPGGKKDDTDADVTAAALREAHEEIGLPKGAAQVLGHLPCHETVTGFQVTPVVALVPDAFAVKPEPGEVAEVFRVPLSHVTDLSRFSIQGRRWRGQTRHYYTVPWGPYYIWGATARILRGLAARLS